MGQRLGLGAKVTSKTLITNNFLSQYTLNRLFTCHTPSYGGKIEPKTYVLVGHTHGVSFHFPL